jgi:hypothetical protein
VLYIQKKEKVSKVAKFKQQKYFQQMQYTIKHH